VIVSGVVRDTAGAPVASAGVLPRTASGPLPATLTAADGSFSFDPGPTATGRLRIRVPGFADAEYHWSVGEPLIIVLSLARLADDVTVTASREEARLGDTAARVVVLDRGALQATPALTVDDVLRQVPGFSLFRRSGSRVANPTAQGASLRGVGPSGASRTLALLDGVPLNDAFGGWIYWSRLPRAALERIEVVEGGLSDLYGSAALGGVIQALSRTDAPALALEASGGNEGTAAASIYAAGRRGDWAARVAGEALATDGYGLVPSGRRGIVDAAAGARHWSGSLTLEREWSPDARAFLRGSLFGESRTNGTPLQVNDTAWRELSGGGEWRTRGAGAFTFRARHGGETYHQTFSAVSADRASESLTRRQRVPSTAGGFSLHWSRQAGARHTLALGIDGSQVRGRSDETVVTGGQATSLVSAGGREWGLAVFGSDRIALGSRALLTLGARLDHWSERAGALVTTPLGSGAASSTVYPDHGSTIVSPRASLLWHATVRLRLTAAAYAAFRAPTLNELYRSFRVGDVLTLANPALTAERLRGGEAGAAWSAREGGLRARAVAYVAEIEDPVANVTLRTTAQLVTRERRNLGRARTRGVELDAEARLGRRWRGTLGYALVDAAVARFPASPEIEGKRLPQTPRHQLTFGIGYRQPRLCALDVQGRASSRQFEDDQNRLPLDGYFALDAQASRPLGRRFDVFAAVENATGRRYAVGLTPIPTLGPPRLFRIGIRLDSSRR